MLGRRISWNIFRLNTFPKYLISNMKTLRDIKKTHLFTENLPADPLVPRPEDVVNKPLRILHESRPIYGALYTFVPPIEEPDFKVISVSPTALEDLDLDISNLEDRNVFEKLVSGNYYWKEHFPWAQCYGGYQFGFWADQLGDGRVVSIVELTNEDTNNRFEIQLKGAGKTPFGRFADGNAVVRSSIREYLACEYLNALGVPTTRALALTVLPARKAVREKIETCAIVARMAPSWIRIGTFDLLYKRNDWKLLKILADYCIQHVFGGEDSIYGHGNIYSRLFLEIVRRNAIGVAYWQAYAFINGVLNTDNTSILGLSLDFGPFAFMDHFDPDYTPNHDDINSRYCFKMQPTIIWWNLNKLAEDLFFLINEGSAINEDDPNPTSSNAESQEKKRKLLQEAEALYKNTFLQSFLNLLRMRLGLRVEKENDTEMISSLLNLLSKFSLDYNSFFYCLSELESLDKTDEEHNATVLISLLNKNKLEADAQLHSDVASFLNMYKLRLASEIFSDDDIIRKRLKAKNPKFILRNWILEDIIQKVENGDLEYIDRILPMILHPFKETWNIDEELERRYCETPSEFKANSQCSCSS